MNRPRINITIPTYNRAECIIRCLKSSIDQTYANTTITIVDDNSTDDTFARIEPYLKDQNITYIKLKTNVGTAAAKNVSILLSNYDAITFHDSDDYFYRFKITEQAKAMFMEEPYYYPHIRYHREYMLDHRSQFDIVTSAFEFVDKSDQVHVLGEDRIVHVESFFPNLIRDHKSSNSWDWILINNALFSKNVFQTLGGYMNHIEEDREIRNRCMIYGHWFNHIHHPLLKKIEDQPNLINGNETGRTSQERQQALDTSFEKTKKMWQLTSREEIEEVAREPIDIPDLKIEQIINAENLTFNDTIPVSDSTRSQLQDMLVD